MVSAGTNVISTMAGIGTPGYNGDGIPGVMAEIDSPMGIALDTAGDIYFADPSGRIREVQAVGDNSQLVIQGSPASAGPVEFAVTVQDATGATAGPVTYSMSGAANPQPLSLPVPNPITLESAVAGQPYSGSIVAIGGKPPLTWIVEGYPLSASGTPYAIGGGLSVSATGGNTMSVSGTPSAAGPISFYALVRDN